MTRCPFAGCWHFFPQVSALRWHLYSAHSLAFPAAAEIAHDTFDGNPPHLLTVDGRLVNFRTES